VDLKRWGTPNGQVHSDVGPQGTFSYRYDLGPVHLSLVFTVGGQVLKSLGIEWPAEKKAATIETLATLCATCGRPSATVKLVPTEQGTRLIYSGPGGSSGDVGDLITPARAGCSGSHVGTVLPQEIPCGGSL
jgi:hypothetical protein